MAEQQSAAQKTIGDFAPKPAELIPTAEATADELPAQARASREPGMDPAPDAA
jgi:hypothetical protein